MRVAVANWSSRQVGGVETYVSLVLPALQRAGISTAFWNEIDDPADRPLIPIPEGVSTFSVAKLGLDTALRSLREWTPDVVYAQGMLHRDVEARLLEIAPAVFFLHTYTGTCISGAKTFKLPHPIPCERTFGPACLAHYFPHGCGGRSPVTMWRHFQNQKTQLQLLHRYRSIVTHTGHMRGEMARHGLRAEVIPYPVEAPTTSNMDREHSSWRLLFIGRMDVLKGGLVLLDALPKVLAAAKRPVHLTFAGDGPNRAKWEARARHLMAASPNLTIEFAGWVSQEQIAALTSAVDLLVVPSLWPEPFGSVGPVAGRSGVPAAAFAVGGIPEWLVDGETGHLAPGNPPTADGLAQAIVRCLENPHHYSDLKEGACRMALRFTMERHLPPLLAVFERAAASRVGDARLSLVVADRP